MLYTAFMSGTATGRLVMVAHEDLTKHGQVGDIQWPPDFTNALYLYKGFYESVDENKT